MSNRKFDTYMPGAAALLEIFVESIMSGRFLFFVIKVNIVTVYSKICCLTWSALMKAWMLNIYYNYHILHTYMHDTFYM